MKPDPHLATASRRATIATGVLFALTLLGCGGLMRPAPATAAPGTAALRSFARCIDASGAKFYGAHWCGYCKKQKLLFGAAAGDLPYVECFDPGTRNKRAACAGIDSFPRWRFTGGVEKKGMLSLNALATLTGCPAPS